ncbi:hypothetical protein B0G81_5001 [Paraburkholderia sp. BL6665CI2N2]|nr:hypothetical protein B0G81_5001 [Paraburkholderia sp. BL6665CI2N2]
MHTPFNGSAVGARLAPSKPLPFPGKLHCNLTSSEARDVPLAVASVERSSLGLAPLPTQQHQGEVARSPA